MQKDVLILLFYLLQVISAILTRLKSCCCLWSRNRKSKSNL